MLLLGFVIYACGAFSYFCIFGYKLLTFLGPNETCHDLFLNYFLKARNVNSYVLKC